MKNTIKNWALATTIVSILALTTSCGVSKNTKRGCDGRKKQRVEMGWM